MGRNDIHVDDLRPVVTDMGPSFQTLDVADDARLRALYPELIATSRYNASVGSALSIHRVALGITKGSGKQREMTWHKQG